MRSFKYLIWAVLLASVLTALYWLVMASDRYVSEVSVITQRTDQVTGQSFDFSTLVAGAGVSTRPDQLLLREYLLSIDMLHTLDSELDLRGHYSDPQRDWLSRMWGRDRELEWFHRHYLSRTEVEFDDYAGVLRIKAQAYDPATAKAITGILVREGESFMNRMAHELADVQVTFLAAQVEEAQERVMQTRQALLEFQNASGMVSPQAVAESIAAIIARLESQRTDLQTQLAALPARLDANHPNIVRLKQSIEAVDRQIARERAKLASPSGNTLNYTVEAFQRLEMDVSFAQDIYKTALVALERGRMDATRTLKKVSVLQEASLPEYPLQPRRIYNAIVTLLLGLVLAGIIKLLESIVMDHVD